MVLKKKDHFFQESLLDAGRSKQNQAGNLEIEAYFKMKDLFLSSAGVKAGMNWAYCYHVSVWNEINSFLTEWLSPWQ